ncbi:MAG: chemotaxis protein CheW, partial [Pedosphaera sp.]|nr:chemotaxis protein CheW [Pedosphaera sp.]
MIHSYATFCGVQILTFCVMGNHFHILVAVPRRPDQLPTLDEFLLRLAGIASAERVEEMRALLEPMEEAGRAAILESYWDRMWNISVFMKELKQRFSQWYNLRNDRKGYLWEERFRSALLDPEGNTLSTMAAYIDLNPVRAGIAEDPKDYRWSGYAEAIAGKESALAGYQNLMKLLAGETVDPTSALEAYRVILYDRGEQKGINKPGEVPVVRLGLDPKVVAAVIAANGRLERAAFLMCRIRYFQDGAVL